MNTNNTNNTNTPNNTNNNNNTNPSGGQRSLKKTISPLHALSFRDRRMDTQAKRTHCGKNIRNIRW